jgi:hypothetical protein
MTLLETETQRFAGAKDMSMRTAEIKTSGNSER